MRCLTRNSYLLPSFNGFALVSLGAFLLGAVVQLANGAAKTPNPGLKYYYPAPEAPVVDVEADVVVYGGTSGGVVAAVKAAREGKSVALVVFGRHVGGMTSGGLTRTDGVNPNHQGGITAEYFNKVGSRWFEPYQAEAEFERILAHPIPGDASAPPVPTYFEQRLDRVEKDGNRITAIYMENGSVYRGRVFIDATYEGDLMARSGVSYTYGREARSQYGESLSGKVEPYVLEVDPYVEAGNPTSGLLPTLIDEPVGEIGSGDKHIQAYNFRMYTVLDQDPSNYLPLFKPATYDADKFEILYRYHKNGGRTRMKVGNDINNHQMFSRETATDHIGGNRWPDGKGGFVAWPVADYATREKMYQDHVAWQLGMLYYVQNDPRYASLTSDPEVEPQTQQRIHQLIRKMKNLGLPKHSYPETNGWPHELYVREGLRMVSDFVATQAHYEREIYIPDSVALANYHSDSHHVRRIPSPDGKSILVSGDTGGRTAPPWRIPYRSIIPKEEEADNLYVIWSISATHVAFRSMRMEPCLMVIGESAATAASLVIDQDISVQDLDYNELKKELIADGQILEGPKIDLPAEAGVLVDNLEAMLLTRIGPWPVSDFNSEQAAGDDYMHDANAMKGEKSVTFHPKLPESGKYAVYMNWTSNPNRASNVPVVVQHADGGAEIFIDQRQGGGQWYRLGEWSFDDDGSAGVVIKNEGTDGYVIADAVFFEPIK